MLHRYSVEFGHYWSLIETDKRPGRKYSASMSTPYKRFDESCMELYYQFTGSSDDGHISVKVRFVTF